MSILKLLENLPRIEVLIRNLYWRFEFFQKLFLRPRGKIHCQSSVRIDLNELIHKLILFGIEKDDIVIVHSSMQSFKRSGISANELIDKLLNDLCPDGTLVLPAFPLYAEEPKGINRINENISNKIFKYDVQKTRTWTGELGSAMMRMPGARRSIHPLNSIVAIGKNSDEIFANEDFESLDLPCGLNSTWRVLAEKNAKILALGVDLAHSLTMIHVAEDCYEKEWPIKDWYRDRLFQINNNNEQRIVKIRERHPRWSLSFAERKLSKDIFDNKIAEKIYLGDLEISYSESKELLNFLNDRKLLGYPYYLPWVSKIP